MRDPMTLAHRIVKPIPKVSRRRSSPVDDARGWFNWTVRLHRKPYWNLYVSPFIYIGKYELYFESFIDIWHTDPLGDAGPACHGRKFWKWHIHHLSISPSFWYDFRQKHITRCAWCGKKSSKELGRVNHSDGRTVYHAACQSEAHKHFHSHDPRGCYACSGSAAWEWERKQSNTRRVVRNLFGPKK